MGDHESNRHSTTREVLTLAQSPHARKWAYNVTLAVIPVLVAYGLMEQGQVQVWVNFAAAVLGFTATSLARPNVPEGDE